MLSLTALSQYTHIPSTPSTTPSTYTPLHIAAEAANAEKLEALLIAESDPTIKCQLIKSTNNSPKSPLDIAFKKAVEPPYNSPPLFILLKHLGEELCDTLKAPVNDTPFIHRLAGGLDLTDLKRLLDMLGEKAAECLLTPTRFDYRIYLLSKHPKKIPLLISYCKDRRLELFASQNGNSNALFWGCDNYSSLSFASKILINLSKEEQQTLLTHRNKEGSPFHKAAHKKNEDFMQLFLFHSQNPIEQLLAQDDQGNTPLHIACKKKDAKTVELLVNTVRQIDKNLTPPQPNSNYLQLLTAQNKDGDTPIHTACSYPDLGDSLGFNPKETHLLHTLLSPSTNPLSLLLQKNNTGDTPIYSLIPVIHSDRIDFLFSLLKDQCYPLLRSQNTTGDTIVHKAFTSAPSRHALLLIDQALLLDKSGAIKDELLSLKNSNGDTPFHLMRGVNRERLEELHLLHDPQLRKYLYTLNCECKTPLATDFTVRWTPDYCPPPCFSQLEWDLLIADGLIPNNSFQEIDKEKMLELIHTNDFKTLLPLASKLPYLAFHLFYNLETITKPLIDKLAPPQLNTKNTPWWFQDNFSQLCQHLDILTPLSTPTHYALTHPILKPQENTNQQHHFLDIAIIHRLFNEGCRQRAFELMLKLPLKAIFKLAAEHPAYPFVKCARKSMKIEIIKGHTGALVPIAYYTTLILSMLDESKLDGDNAKNVIFIAISILSLRCPKERFRLYEKLFHFSRNDSLLKKFATLRLNNSFPQHLTPFILDILTTNCIFLSKNEIIDLLIDKCPQHPLRDGSLRLILGKIIFTMLQQDQDYFKSLLDKLLSWAHNKKFKEQCHSLLSIMDLPKSPDFLKQLCLSKENDFSKTLHNAISDLFKDNISFDDYQTLSSFFSTTRNPTSFLKYLGSLLSLPTQESNQCISSFFKFLQCLLADIKSNANTNNHFPSFLSTRYNSPSPHLQKLQKINPSVFNIWKELPRTKIKFEKAPTSLTSLKRNVTPRDILKQAFDDNHLDKKVLAKLYSFLHDNEPASTQTNAISTDLLAAQELLIDIASNKTPCTSTSISEIHRLLKIDATHAFHGDLLLLQSPKTSTFNHQSNNSFIAISDHPIDLLLIGTDVTGSCQHVSSSQFNKGLLGSILNGYTLPIGHKNTKTGEWITRVLLRLAITTQNNIESPILLLERIYPQNADPSLKDQLTHACLTIAKTLNIPLAHKEATNSNLPTDLAIILEKGLSPCDYVDSSGQGLITQYPCTILNCNLLTPN